ncbi:hypothetical protein ABZ671_00860 [Micromonospora sp. NPDC006766]|uniref:hypothetical protein n=1 Tax=Micromonospora sp. NPDC006766 TaxID=3154778 RepID=UPI0033E7B6CD
MITAKIVCQSKTEPGPTTRAAEGEDNRHVIVTFVPDYADGRNKEWALHTPGLSLTMGLRGSVADQFQPGKAYTLTFSEEA